MRTFVLAVLFLTACKGSSDAPSTSASPPSPPPAQSAVADAQVAVAITDAAEVDAAVATLDAAVAGGNIDAGSRPLPDDFVRSEAMVGRLGTVLSTDQVEGGLSADAINAVVKESRRQVSDCYKQALKRSPNLEGKLTITFKIDKTGKVTSAERARGSTLTDDGVTKCVTRAIKTWKFPQPEGGGPAIVTYPFVFVAQQ